jgi:hypothetical protein
MCCLTVEAGAARKCRHARYGGIVAQPPDTLFDELPAACPVCGSAELVEVAAVVTVALYECKRCKHLIDVRIPPTKPRDDDRGG